ncbi:hypothetical protein C8K30_105236 [Promicromonospora sp. AC04]|nr:hypothetical protein C8K30_105236 [Promicromonospora sp. AC04]
MKPGLMDVSRLLNPSQFGPPPTRRAAQRAAQRLMPAAAYTASVSSVDRN